MIILAWAQKGIVGRGVLVDYYTWALEHAPYNPMEQYSIPFSNLQECIRSQNLTFRKGDILIVRSGFTVAYDKLDIPAREAKAAVNPAHFAGVEQSEEVLEWIWENQFAAIAGDAVGFECWRITLSERADLVATKKDYAMHEVFLAGWGMPIGEMFYLEKLAEECRRLGRWTFFFTSEPLNVNGGVASPPNALAIL
jgi:hypothetical protein